MFITTDTCTPQMDNCFRENKNRWVLAFCYWLVFVKIFRKVKISFLIKGHTHEDVDQFFSNIAIRLDQDSPKTYTEFVAALNRCRQTTKGTVIVEELREVGDFKRFFADRLGDIHNHTHPHHFKFEMINGETRVCCRFRRNTAWTDPENIFDAPPPTLMSIFHCPLKPMDHEEKDKLLQKHISYLDRNQHADWVNKLRLFRERMTNSPMITGAQPCLVQVLQQINSMRNRTFPAPTESMMLDDNGVYPDISEIPSLDIECAMQMLEPVQEGHQKPSSESYCNLPKLRDRPIRYKNAPIETFDEHIQEGQFICYRASEFHEGVRQDIFWFGLVSNVNHTTRRYRVDWYDKTDQSKPWYEAIYKRAFAYKTPGSKQIEYIYDEMDLDDIDPIVLFNVYLTKSGHISADDVSKLMQKLVDSGEIANDLRESQPSDCE
jgi:hypothetical protein